MLTASRKPKQSDSASALPLTKSAQIKSTSQCLVCKLKPSAAAVTAQSFMASLKFGVLLINPVSQTSRFADHLRDKRTTCLPRPHLSSATRLLSHPKSCSTPQSRLSVKRHEMRLRLRISHVTAKVSATLHSWEAQFGMTRVQERS